MSVYLDNNATTKTDPRVIEAMMPYIELFYGNASSIHNLGTKASVGIEKARNIIASKINAAPEEIFFTSGGSEANNWALKGFFFANKNKGNHIIVSAIEHPSVLETTKWLEKQNAEITYLPVDSKGFVKIEDVHKAIRKDTILVSIMHANNEVGTIEPVEEIDKICNEKNVAFHTDACQSFTKVDIDIAKLNVNMVTLNAHKIHGPKGVGALFIKKGTPIEAFIHGGGQESGKRSGTYNTPAIVGFGTATELATNDDINKMKKLRDYFIAEMFKNLDGVTLYGPSDENRLCNNINLGFSAVKGKYLVQELNKKNFILSAGSACSSAQLMPSHVLAAMGIKDQQAHEATRISLSRFTTIEELDSAIENICKIVNFKRNEA